MKPAKTARFLQGMKKGIPIMVGYIPIAIAYGVIASEAHIPILLTVLMSMLVYAGASQFMAVQMITVSTAAFEIILATFILNLRHLIMSLSLHNALERVPLKWKALLSFGITDESFAMATLEEESGQKDAFFISGLFTAAYSAWVVGSVVGALLYQWIPSSISESMSIALYAMFIGLLIPAVKRSWSKAAIAGLSMAICAGFYYGLEMSMGWSIVSATIAASVAGIFIKKEETA